jgi:hypothetical protein
VNKELKTSHPEPLQFNYKSMTEKDLTIEIGDEIQKRDLCITLEENETPREYTEGLANDFLDYIDLDYKAIKKLQKEKNDFWNDKTPSGQYFCDVICEWADSNVDIYYQDMYKHLDTFSFYTDEAIENGLCDLKGGLTGILQAGQYEYYSQLGSAILEVLKTL